MKLIFLGTGAGSGVPAFYCHCQVCKEAAEDVRCRRTRSAICISGKENLLFDAPPELSFQLRREQIDRVDCLFLTHEHHDHSAGLGDLELYARFHLRGKLPAVMSEKTRQQLEQSHGPLGEWMEITLLEPGQTLERSGLAVTALEVSHAPGCLGYLISKEGSRTAYLPDTGPLPQSTRARLRQVDNLILDCTFWGDNWYPDDHLAFQQTVELAQELEADTLFLTHLSMHYSQPVTSREIEAAIAPYGGRVKLAYDGLQVPLESKAKKCPTTSGSLVTN
jgi:phosphoribosyl 1,2-cyclic phosphate phosphodiesterase